MTRTTKEKNPLIWGKLLWSVTLAKWGRQRKKVHHGKKGGPGGKKE